MSTRAAIVAEARSWISPQTAFAHQAHTKGLATDCIGFVAGVGIAAGIFPADAWQRDFAPHAGYYRSPANGALEAVCRQFLTEVETPQPGDVLLMRFGTEPQHLAIVVPYSDTALGMVHAYSRVGKVVSHRYAGVWQARTVAVFAYPGVAA